MDPDFIDFIITNLKILGMVKVNEKISLHKGHLQIRNSPFDFLQRWLCKDSRDTLIFFIQDLIKKISKLLIQDQNDFFYYSISSILNEIEKVYTGLNNLKITYNNDSVTVVRIENIITHFKDISVKARTFLI